MSLAVGTVCIFGVLADRFIVGFAFAPVTAAAPLAKSPFVVAKSRTFRAIVLRLLRVLRASSVLHTIRIRCPDIWLKACISLMCSMRTFQSSRSRLPPSFASQAPAATKHGTRQLHEPFRSRRIALPGSRMGQPLPGSFSACAVRQGVQRCRGTAFGSQQAAVRNSRPCSRGRRVPAASLQGTGVGVFPAGEPA